MMNPANRGSSYRSIPLTSPVDSSTRYSRDVDPDAWYWAAIEKYKDNPEAYAYLSQNPWLIANNPYSPSLGNQIVDLFGDNSAEQNYINELMQKSRDYLGQWERGQYEQKYESPVEQVKREEAAGINSALNPGMITPGEAAENDQPFSTTPMPGAGTGFQSMIDVGQGLTSIVSTAFNFVTAFQQLKGLSLDNATKSLNLNEGLRSTAWGLIKEGISEFLNGDMVRSSLNDDPELLSKPEFVQVVTKYFKDRIAKQPFSHRQRKQLEDITEQLISSKGEVDQSVFTNQFQTLLNQSYSELYKSRNDVASSSGLPGADKESIAALKFIGNDIYKPLRELSLEVDKLILQKEKGYYKRFNAVNPETGLTGSQTMADSDSLNYYMQKTMFEVKKRVTDAFEEINKKILGSRDIPPGWKIGLQAGVSSFESLTMAQLANGLHFSTMSSQSSGFGKYGPTQSTSSSFSM